MTFAHVSPHTTKYVQMADGPRYYRVSPKLWQEPGWDDDTRLLALYVLTCDHRTTEGLFRLPKPYILADLEWSPQRLAQPFRQLCADGFIDYDEDAKVLLIVKALKYQGPSNPNGVTAALRALEMVPATRLDSAFYGLSQRYSQRLAEALPERFTQRFAEPPSPTPALTPAPEPLSTGVDLSRVDQQFDDEFWPVYPERRGKKVGKEASRVEWRKLTDEQRARAVIGAKHLAASDQMPKDPERFLKADKAGAFPFDDWQEPAKPRDGPSRLHNVTQIAQGGRF
jgi:hypothetical protein